MAIKSLFSLMILLVAGSLCGCPSTGVPGSAEAPQAGAENSVDSTEASASQNEEVSAQNKFFTYICDMSSALVKTQSELQTLKTSKQVFETNTQRESIKDPDELAKFDAQKQSYNNEIERLEAQLRHQITEQETCKKSTIAYPWFR